MPHALKVFIRKCLERLLSPLGHVLYSHDGKIKTHAFRYSPLIRISECHPIAGPGFRGITGGVFNPGAVKKDGEIIVVARGEKIAHRDFSKHSHKAYLSSCEHLLMKFDHNIKLTTAERLSFSGLPPALISRPYDPRLFWFKGLLYMNHCLHVFHQAREKYQEALAVQQYRQAISALDIEKKEIRFLGEPKVDFPLRYHEKNWVFLESEGRLYAIYSIAPYLLLEAVDWPRLEFKTVVKKDSLIRKDLSRGMLRLTTNPVNYDEDHWFLLFHKRETCYAFWGLLISKKTLMPVKISSRPIFTSINARGHASYVLYPSAVVELGDTLVFFMGEGDSHLSYAKADKKKLNDLFIPLEAGTGC